MSEDPAPSNAKRIEEAVFVRAPHVIAGGMFLVAAGLNIANVIARYVFFSPIFWAEEIMIFVVIWTVFLLAASITYRGAHLSMDLLYSGFSPFWKRVVNIAIALCLIGSSLFAASQSWKVVSLYLRTGDVTPATGIPLSVPHAALLVGFVLMALAAIFRIRSYFTGKFE
jgi:TRAP-type C4-dicarboxylate transport system permease small subunit